MDTHALFKWAFSQPPNPNFKKRFGKLGKGTDPATAHRVIRQYEEANYMDLYGKPIDWNTFSASTASSAHATSGSTHATSSSRLVSSSSSGYQCSTCGKLFESRTMRDEHRSRRGHH